jgi:hypothetical protein
LRISWGFKYQHNCHPEKWCECSFTRANSQPRRSANLKVCLKSCKFV